MSNLRLGFISVQTDRFFGPPQEWRSYQELLVDDAFFQVVLRVVKWGRPVNTIFAYFDSRQMPNFLA
jgi:hypothetical protein